MKQVKESVEAKEQNDMGSDVLDVVEARDHVELGKDGKGLQPPGEGLEDPIQGPVVVHDQSQDQGGYVQVPVGECV